MPYAKTKNIIRLKDQAQFYLVKFSVPVHQRIVTTIPKGTQMAWTTKPLVWDLLTLKKSGDRDQVKKLCNRMENRQGKKKTNCWSPDSVLQLLVQSKSMYACIYILCHLWNRQSISLFPSWTGVTSFFTWHVLVICIYYANHKHQNLTTAAWCQISLLDKYILKLNTHTYIDIHTLPVNQVTILLYYYTQ